MRLELSTGFELDTLDDSDVVYGRLWSDDWSPDRNVSALTVEGVLAKLAPTAPEDKIAAAAEVLEGILGIPTPWQPTDAQFSYFEDMA